MTRTHAAAAEPRWRKRDRARAERRGARPQVLTAKQLEREQRDAGDVAELELGLELARPRTRGECVGGVRPCPWVSCRFHLYLDVEIDQYGRPRLKLNFPDLEPWELKESCSLDVADRIGGRGTQMNHEAVGRRLNVSHAGILKIEAGAFAELDAGPAKDLLELLRDEAPHPRRLPLVR